MHASHYERNLVNFIKALRKDFNAPNAKFVLATMGEATKDMAILAVSEGGLPACRKTTRTASLPNTSLQLPNPTRLERPGSWAAQSIPFAGGPFATNRCAVPTTSSRRSNSTAGSILARFSSNHVGPSSSVDPRERTP